MTNLRGDDDNRQGCVCKVIDLLSSPPRAISLKVLCSEDSSGEDDDNEPVVSKLSNQYTR